MESAWQNTIVALVVLAAAVHVGRAAWQALAARKSGCGGCGTCPASKQPEPALVSLELNARGENHAVGQQAERT